MDSDERAIREFNARWIEAVNAGDLQRLLGMLADDAVLLNPGGPPIGREGFSAKFAGAHRELRIDCVSELEEVVVVGDVAYSLAKDSLTIAPRAGGAETRLAGNRLTVYRKRGDGQWVLARDAHTLGG